MEAARFRSEFPVFERFAYLNAGTDGPLPRRAVEAARAELELELGQGRSGAEHFGRLGRIAEQLRVRLAALFSADRDEVALTRSTTDGVNVVLSGLALGPGDEVLTSDEEHAGLLAPLGALSRRGVAVRTAPFASVPEHVGSRTRLIAMSHVSWIRGAVAPLEGLRNAGVPVLLDGAQALGAMPVDVRTIGCDFYAAAGQKWLCGPDATGSLFVSERWWNRLGVPWPNITTLADPERPLELVPARGARRYDGGMIAGPLVAAARASLEVLESAGWEWIFERARAQADQLRELVAARAELIPGGPTTLVTWQAPNVADAGEAYAAVQALHERGVVVRSFPGKPWLRATVGAWNSDEDLERLVEAL